MSKDSTFDEELTLEVLVKLDQCCEEFEDQLKCGHEPRIEDFLDNAPDGRRTLLLRELLAIELDHRFLDEAPDCSLYYDRFPENRGLIDKVIEHLLEHRQSADAQLPRQLGHFELLEVIGQGGMGVVYRAHQRDDGRLIRTVALKVVRPDRVGTSINQRFLAERQFAAQLEHPQIVRVYEVGCIEGQYYFSMELIQGKNLDEMLRDGPLSSRKAAEIVRLISKAVAYAHEEHGIIHRDIKPRNILFNQQQHPYLVDFGLAKWLFSSREITETGELLGTASYMSPEQALRQKDISVSTDVYSLGATLYTILTGRPPFQAASVVETLNQVVGNEPVPPKQLNSRIDRDLETICLKCLEKHPSKRFGSAAELGAELDRYLRHEPIKSRPVGSLTRGWRWCRRHTLISSLSATIFLFLMVVMVLTTVGYVMQSKLAGELAAENARTEQNLYFVSVRLALEEVKNGDFDAARQLLERAPEANRHWEWHWLRNACSGIEGFPKFGIAPGECMLARISQDGQLLSWGQTEPNRDLSWFVTNAKSGEIIRKFQGMGLTISPDSTHVAISQFDGTVETNDLVTGDLIQTYNEIRTNGEPRTYSRNPPFPCYSPNGRFVGRYRFDASLCLWDQDTNQEVFNVSLPADGMLSLDLFNMGWLLGSFRADQFFSADGKMLAFPSESDPTSICLWDVDTWQVIQEFKGHQARVLMCLFSPDRTRMVSVDHKFVAKVWNPATGKEIFETRASYGYLRFSPDSKRLAVVDGDPYDEGKAFIQLHDTMNGEVKWKYMGAGGNIDFFRDGSILLGGVKDQHILAIEVESGHRLPVAFPTGGNERFVGIEKLPKSDTFIFGGNGKLQLLSPNDFWMGDAHWNHERFRFNSNSKIAWSTKYHRDQNVIKAWDVAEGHCVFETSVLHHLFSENGNELAGSNDESTVIWCPASEKSLEQERISRAFEIAATGRPLAFSTNNRRLIDKTVNHSVTESHSNGPPFGGHRTVTTPTATEFGVWSFDAPDPLLSFQLRTNSPKTKGPPYFVRQPDGRELISNIFDVRYSENARYIAALTVRDLHLWDCIKAHRIAVLKHAGTVTHATFSRSGEYLATVCQPKTGPSKVYIWNSANGKLKGQFTHNGVVHTLTLSADGESLVCISNESTQSFSMLQDKVSWSIAGSSWKQPLFSSDGQWILNRKGYNEDFYVIQAATGLKIELPSSERCENPVFSPDSQRIVAMDGGVGNSYSTLRLFDVTSGTEVFRWAVPDAGGGGANVYPLFSPDGSEILVRNLRMNSKMSFPPSSAN